MLNSQDLLSQLGIDRGVIGDAEKAALDTQGFVVLPDLLSAEEIGHCKREIDELGRREGDAAGGEYTVCNDNAFRLHNLLEKSTVFDQLWLHPKVLACVGHVLPQFKLSMINVRGARPGQRAQKLHADWRESCPAKGEYYVCDAMWLLDDFLVNNGATRFVPGSHLLGKLPQEVLSDRSAPVDGEVLLLARAGSVVVFNSHIWHAGTRNETAALRLTVNAFYSRREIAPIIDHRAMLSQATKKRFSPAEQLLLDVT